MAAAALFWCPPAIRFVTVCAQVRMAADSRDPWARGWVMRARSGGVVEVVEQSGEEAPELAQLTVLHLDQDYELVTGSTGQAVERLRLV